MKLRFALFSVLALAAGSSQAALIAHYTFDSVFDTNKTADSVGSSFATLGNKVQINTTVSGRIGNGALEMLGGGDTPGPGNGALTSNSFTWTTDARTVTFWWRADSPNTDTLDGAFVSFGDTSGNGTRFEIKEQHNVGTQTPLRVEIQGTGLGTNPTNFDDGSWHFVAVTVPNSAAFADISWYVNGSGTDLNTSTNTLAIATGAGPLAFGDSILTSGTNDRVPNGFMDDFQLYDEVLTSEQISFLYNNPGSVIGNPIDNFETYISSPAFGLAPGQQGFDQDSDADGLANGLEAWFGTHPGEFNTGLANLATDGTVTTFIHPQHENPPADIIGLYEWSPNLVDWYAGDGVDGPPGGPTLIFSANSAGATTTVTATAAGPIWRLFFRAGAQEIP